MYIKGTNSREPLRLAVEIRTDAKGRETVTEKKDERLLAITARDIVAAEAHFHPSCYRDYTRPGKLEKSQLSQEDLKY